MAYTLWHSGILIGETDFEGRQRHGSHLVGIFRPTQYGRDVFPKLTGIMSAAFGLKQELKRRALPPELTNPDALADVLETSESGQKVLSIGRHLSEVSLHDGAGTPLDIASIAFIDTSELDRLSRRLSVGFKFFTRLRLRRRPRLLVSVTLQAPGSTAGVGPQVGGFTQSAPNN